MNKRKIIMLAAALVMVAILGIGGTFAYFTDNETAENVFTVGNVDIKLEEEKWEETGKEEAKDVYPGEPLPKDPTVENIGKNPCFVRVKVTGLDQFTTVYGEDAMITLRYMYAPGHNAADWCYNEADDYYYYFSNESGVLAVGAKTKPVFDQVVIPFEVTNNAEAQAIVVKVEAIQAQGARPSFAAVEKMTVAEIAEWFGNYSEDLAE